MHPKRPKVLTVEEYFLLFPKPIQDRLQTLRGLIKKLLPQAVESISYAIPTYRQGKKVVYYAAYDRHISIYIPPVDSLRARFAEELKNYKTTKSAVHFSNDKELPIELIEKMLGAYLKLS